ncbi:MAG: phenylacetate-CoA oxygenase subunit PaaC [Gammaproteobacteria bacterium]|nr:phenylacetate-CoA oxygenase subunit PaaC [Gammaproteobacteria bacterium]MBT8111867.1 phenylacetate-CoA oxygenase subunit PaaC [Gammaproteobacteria bacterium]
MTPEQHLTAYILRLGDNALVLGQRMLELVAAYPELEEELANANFALDYIGQARMFYSYAGELEGAGRSEDDFAYFRPEHEFKNLLLVEQPNGHFGDTIVRQVLFDVYYLGLLEALTRCSDQRLAEIAARAEKEVRYHLRHSAQWLVRLGDGTEESHRKAQRSLDGLWRFTGEMFAADALDEAVLASFGGPNLADIAADWQKDISTIVDEATLSIPQETHMASGGKQGMHTEHFGYLVAEMQSLPRTYPGATW